MKRKLLLAGIASTILVIWTAALVKAQPAAPIQRYETAIIKWDGPDKLQLLTPQRSEYIRVFKTGVRLPPDIHDEAFCLTWGANKLAQEGWEPVGLDSTRLLMRRAVMR